MVKTYQTDSNDSLQYSGVLQYINPLALEMDI